MEDAAAVLDPDVAAVREGIEAAAQAVGKGHVFQQAFPVDLEMAHLLEVRDQVQVGQPEAAQPALIGRAGHFAGKLGVGVDFVGTVHGAGAAAHHDAAEIFQEFPQADLMDEAVLRGRMPAAHHHPVGLRHQFGGAVRVAALEHRDGAGPDAGFVDAVAHAFLHGTGEAAVVGSGADQQHARCAPAAGHFLQSGFHGRQEAVVFRKMVFSVTGGTSGEKECHTAAKIQKKPFPGFFCISVSNRNAYFFFSSSRISRRSWMSSGTTGSAGAGAGSSSFFLVILLMPLRTKKMQSAMMKKSTAAWMKLP